MKSNLLHDLLVTVSTLVISFFLSLFLQTALNIDVIIPSLFVLSVFFISMFTQGYIYGIISALISVIAVNFAFTFPYFSFDFSVHENLVSALIMIIITVLTSALTTKIKLQEKVKTQAEKEKMRANLLRAVSHDLRTPLTAIYGSSSTVIDNYPTLSDESKLDMLYGIKEDAQWLIRMVENLLSVTKIDMTDVKLIKSSVVLEELADSVMAKFKKIYPDRDVTIKMPEDFVTVCADAILIEQVLINLLENAVQHAVGMTELILNIYIMNQKAVFEVIDNGCGMDKEKMKHIFTDYSISDDNPADGTKQNMGIGLSVCASIIKAHGEEIRALKNPKGHGMIFRFTLNLEEEDNE